MIYTAPPSGEWRLEGPEERLLLVEGDLVIDDLVLLGLYRLHHGDRMIAEFAVRLLDAVESSLLDRSSGHRPAAVLSAVLQAETSSLDSVALVLALVLLCADWWVLRSEEG